MSCQLIPFSHLDDTKALRDYLFPDLKDVPVPGVEANEGKTTPDKDGGDGWDEDWGEWADDAMEQEEEEEGNMAEGEVEVKKDHGHKWLQDCHMSVSPTADLIALSNQNRLVLMAPKYGTEQNSRDDTFKYTTVWSGTVSTEDGEFVTAVLCLPLASQKRSTQGAPDWTCVVVGFSTGYIRMFTETGTLLLSQKLHTEPVQKLKCNTYTPPRYMGVAEQHEELTILYLRVLVTIDGFSLFQALKACRNQVARATASGEASLQPPPLAYKKWAPQGMETIVDADTTGVHMPNPFDQMKLASLTSYNASIRPTPPAASVYILTGLGPYLGFFYAIEGSAQPILSEVAYAVASKLKSAIISAASGWLSFGSKNKSESSQDKPPKIEPATPLPLRFNLPDQRREGLVVCLSPNNAYAATTDSFGRVILIDVDRGIAIRMWKGYRDVQVGWVEVREEEPSRHVKQCRVAQFLVIYAARRGILEVWMAGNGPRVAAFNVSKYCELITISHGIMGLNNVTSRGVRLKAFQVGLMEPDGTLKTVSVPFHLALSDKNNKRVRDMHLLKKIKQVLKEHHEESAALESQVKDLLLNIKISSITQQAIERIFSTKYLSARFMSCILQVCTKKLQALGEDHLDIERRLFIQFCNLHSRLIQTYTDVEQLEGDTPSTKSNTEALSRLLCISEEEVDHITCQVDRCVNIQPVKKSTARVTFAADKGAWHVSGFLACFSCNPHVADVEASQSGTSAISVHRDLSEDRKLQLGTFLFERCLSQQCSASDMGAMLRKSSIPMEDIGKLLIWTWLYDSNRTVDSMSALFNILKIITANIDRSKVVVEANVESSWWHSIRDLCHHTHNCQSSYLAAVVARSVAMEMCGLSKAQELEAGVSLSAKDPDADTVSCTSTDMSPVQECDDTPRVDIEAWTLLIKQLEDLTCICCLLKLKPSRPTRGGNSEGITVNISGLLEGGRGCISEIVARHVAHAGFQPEDLYHARADDSVIGETMDTTPADVSSQSTQEAVVWDQMQLLRKRFPHSLENDVLFSNSCWEFTVLWNKQPEEIENLTCALDYLKLVQNAMLRQGVASMMWHMFILKRFQATAQLMEKVGKVPKDRLCRKDVGISEGDLARFVSAICDFFSIIMEANCETNEVPVFNLEPVWNQVKGTVSLVELAIDQKATNYGLLKHHNHLAILMHAILTFNLKSVRVISLFDSKVLASNEISFLRPVLTQIRRQVTRLLIRGKHAFFKDLHSHPLLPNQNVDFNIGVQRKQFLTRVISQSVIRMHDTHSAPVAEPTSPCSALTRLRWSEDGRWPELMLTIGDEFGLDLDHLKRHYVCELYSAGFDKLAAEVLLTVNDHESLGTQLLAIVGQRLAFHLTRLSAGDMVELLANVAPSLSTWIRGMNSKLLVHADVPISDLKALVTQAACKLPEGHVQHELVASLLELVQVL